MPGARILKILFLSWLLATPAALSSQEVVYLEAGSDWSWLPGLSEASAPREAWRESAFDDSTWASGAAPFGFGDPPFGTDLSERDPPMRRNYTSVYLRRTLEIPNPAMVVALEASIDFDDGFILWINGVEVASENPPEEPAFDARASRSHESGTYEIFDLPAPSDFIIPGRNTIAVQFFNVSPSSSDSKFDLALIDPVGIDTTPPSIAGLLPGFNARVRELRRIEVTFSEAVAGVDAGDLLINGIETDSVSGSAAGPYIFEFEQPPEGEVAIGWSENHEIRDLFAPPNDFAAENWTYVIDPNAPTGQLVINELLASNQGGLRDEDGDSPDWIELRNLGTERVELAGWTLTDDASAPGKWTFPQRQLLPGEYLLVFASGKDRAPNEGNLHVNFKLKTSGEYLGLFGPNAPRQAVSELAPAYPPQRTNLAWGRTETGIPGYLATPTPGESNAASEVLEGVVAEVSPSHPRGFYGGGFSLELTCPTENASIYYTLDGSEPTEGDGTLYAGAIDITDSPSTPVRMVRAAAYRRGQLPSTATTWSYIFPERVLSQPRNPPGFPASWPGTAADYEMDPQVINARDNRALGLRALMSLPAISIVGGMDDLFSSSRGVIVHPSSAGPAWEREVTAELILPDGDEGFLVSCGIRVQGGSSTNGWKSKKTSYRLAFRGDYGQSKLRYDFFPGSPVDRFDNLVLDAHLNLTFTHPSHDQRVRSQYVRDMFVSDLQLATGSLAPRSRLCSVFLNGLFWGVFDVHERPDNGYCEEHLGGEKDEWDIFRHSGGQVVDGNSAAWNAMMSRARANLGTLSNYDALQEHLDVLDIADEGRYDQYDLYLDKPQPLVPRHLRFTVPERVSIDGRVLKPLDEPALEALLPRLLEHGVQSVAVGFIHGYRMSRHEQQALRILRKLAPQLTVTLASEVCPEIREYERLTTASANAYVQPLMTSYLNRLGNELETLGLSCPLLLMTSFIASKKRVMRCLRCAVRGKTPLSFLTPTPPIWRSWTSCLMARWTASKPPVGSGTATPCRSST